MEGQHNIDDLRLILKALHDKIETLEAKNRILPSAKHKELSKRIAIAKVREQVLLAKLKKFERPQ